MAEEYDFRSRMTQKAGPLPVWGWVVVIGALAYLYTKRKAVQTAPATATTNDVASTTALYNSEYALALAKGNANVAPNIVNPNVTVTMAPKDTTTPPQGYSIAGFIRIKDSPSPNTVYAIENIAGHQYRVAMTPQSWAALGQKQKFADVKSNDPRASLPIYIGAH